MGTDSKPSLACDESIGSTIFGYAALSAVACIALTSVDVYSAGRLPSVRTYWSAFGLAAMFGSLAGAAYGALVGLVRRLPRWGRLAAWPVVFVAAFQWLAVDLGGYRNFGGRYHTLALAVLGASVAGGVALGAVGAFLQPGAKADGLVASRKTWQRVVVAVLLGLGAIGSVCADRYVVPAGYAGANLALQLTTLYAVAALLWLAPWPWRLIRRAPRLVRWAYGGVVVGLFVIPLVVLSLPGITASRLLERPFSAMSLRLMRAMADIDRDGYAGVLGGGDCRPFNHQINPGAADIPGNGVDDNCDGRDSLDPAKLVVADPPLPTEPSPVSVVLITIDALRPDRMSAYGYKRDTTPNIRAWATQATRFDAAYASGGWTSLAIPSLLRGVYPRKMLWSHLYETTGYRVVRLTDPMPKGQQARALFMLPLHERRKPVSYFLRRRGMYTAAVTDGGFTEILSPKWGMHEGFDVFRQVSVELRGRKRTDEGTADLAIEELRKRPKDKRFFLWAHFFGPHAPNSVHEGLPTFGEDTADKYDHEVLFADLHVGRLLRELEPIPNVIVIVTADHGERFYSAKSRGHGRDMAEASIRVPLLIRGPGFGPGQVKALTSTVDLMPTILAMTGTPAPDGLDGMDLATIMGQKQERPRTIFSDSFTLDLKTRSFNRDFAAAINAKHKLVINRVDNTVSLHERNDWSFPMRSLGSGGRDPELRRALDEYLAVTGGAPVVHP